MVMFLDLRLPGMNGIDLCWKIREKDKISIVYAFYRIQHFLWPLGVPCRGV